MGSLVPRCNHGHASRSHFDKDLFSGDVLAVTSVAEPICWVLMIETCG